MALKLANDATSTLSGDVNTAATVISVQAADAELYPALADGDWFPVTVVDSAGNREIMKATARDGANITVERAQEGTTAKAFTAGARVDVRLTVAAITAFLQTDAQAADSAKLGGQAPDHYQTALGYTPVNKAGDTMTGGLALGGNLALKSSYGAQVFSDGNGDAASYGTYNVKVQGWNGWGFASYDGTIKGVYDFRNGIWDVKGGYKVNGVAVPIANGGIYNMSVSGSAGSVGGVQLGNLVRNYSGGNTISFDWNGTLTLHIDNTDFGDNLPCNITGSAGSVGGVSNPASAGALVQYQSGIVEFGPVGSGGTLDLPSPYVMTGLRQAPSSTSAANEYIRARALKNQ